MEVFYLILICLGILGLVVVLLGILRRNPPENTWKWLLGGAAALLTAVVGTLLLFKKSRQKNIDINPIEPPPRIRPTEEEVKKTDDEAEEIKVRSDSLKEEEDQLDTKRGELDEKKKDLDKRASETDDLLEKVSQVDPSDDGDRVPDPDISEYLRTRR